ncbi:hypothetical protein T440DRAFT_464651 [Plenodomus tracheiphilus IPT5]|uniref:F-box domain-containing protein n=1 Tax=Plenodomus tracheiphilus IPT5 TaxID=1408161 RepID=A0A6A7BGV9_9PLEO|nr:hypothetical protein T440DRAFT_464651 [Plenodomus tracheiphilus IPT5]
MAAARMMADPKIVSLVLHHLSDMKYKDRRQHGPDQPVEFLEFRPTLVPSIRVNKLWAEEGTAILWKRYPHIPALETMDVNRRQWYANKVERLFVTGPASEDDGLAYLEGLVWPNLKTLELEVNWQMHGRSLAGMLHANLQQLDFSGEQTADSDYIASTILPALVRPCTGLRSITLGPDAINREDPIDGQVLTDLLETALCIEDIRVMGAAFLYKDRIFKKLSERPGLKTLEIDLEPNLNLLSHLRDPQGYAHRVIFLKRLQLMCYPEIALALPGHLRNVEEVNLDVARIPKEPAKAGDSSVLDGIVSAISQHCHQLKTFRLNIGQLASGFPSASLLPRLTGTTLVNLATGCPELYDLNLLASEPAAIDASNIFSSQFDAFCQKAPHLKKLSLKFHPQTAIDLEASALQFLGRHCPELEVLRLKVSLQLPNLRMPTLHHDDVPSSNPNLPDNAPGSPSIAVSDHHRGPSLDLEYFAGTKIPNQPLFPHLTHLGFARPQTILSIASDTYTVSSSSHSSVLQDPIIEEQLVRLWAHPLSANFPRLEVLEAWGDWIGEDNESLNYFLPLQEVLASTWEFLSGIEQDLWDEDSDAGLEWNDDISRQSFDSLRSGDDWERASLVNEYPVRSDLGDSEYLDVYDEEPEGMITPGRTIGADDDPFLQAR